MGAELELRRHIERFDLDAGAFPGYFTTKLAHDNGWAPAFAERVVGEYRRYVYLACTADHVVVPSDEVDMAWHQHLLDTEQYWGDFCETVLNRPLHHRPNKGGGVGQQDHLDLYRYTLRTYERTFGCEPPEDIWPPAARRFEPRSTGGRRTFVRNPLSGPAPIPTICTGVLLALALPATVAWVDPPADAPNAFGLDYFDWAGGTSLVALAVAAMLAVLMSYGLRRTLLSADTSAAAAAATTAMDPYETAVLNSNTQHAVNVAIAALVRDDVLGFDGTHRGTRTYSLIRTGPIPTRSHPLEHAAYDAVASDGSTTLSEVHDRVRVDAKRILESLRRRNLLRRHDRYFGRRCAVAGPIVLMALLGGLVIPTADAATAGIIVMSTVVILIFAIGLSAAPPHLTAFGLDALNATRDEHQPKSYVGRDNVVDGRALSWVLALQGATVLRASLSTLRDAITAPAEKGGGGRGVKSAGCGGGTKRSGGSAGAGGYAGSGCGGGYAGSGCGGGSGCGSGCGGGCGGGSS